MYTQGFEQWLKMNKTLAAPLSDLNRTATDICSGIIQQNIALMSENFSRISDQLKRLGNVKKPEELIDLQKECLNENISASIEGTQKLAQITIENLEKFIHLFITTTERQVNSINKTTERVKEYAEKERSR